MYEQDNPPSQDGLRMTKSETAPLLSDANENVTSEDLEARASLAAQFRTLPEEAFAFTQYFQAQVGCPNACVMCSQGSASGITMLSRTDLRNMLSAVKTIALEYAVKRNAPPDEPLLTYGRNEYKRGVIQPFFDDDPFSYPFLYDFIRILHEDLGVKVRLSSVGYSRHNRDLQRMHGRLVADLPHAIDSVRFSYTPYPKGWNNPEEYIADYANMFRTYEPLIRGLGTGKKGVSVEIRFKPQVFAEKKPLTETIISGHHVIRVGPYLLISQDKPVSDKPAKVIELDGRKAILSEEPTPYYVLISENLITDSDWQAFTEEILGHALSVTQDLIPLLTHEDDVLIRTGNMYRLENEDGPFYALDPTFQDSGKYQALEVYPQTSQRKVSGYLDSTRYLLNSLLLFKQLHDIERRSPFPQATWEDVDSVIRIIEESAEQIDGHNSLSSNCIRTQVIPMVTAYRDILQMAGLSPALFFDPRFTYDSGVIHNMGRARGQFRRLATREDIHLTVNEMREPLLTYKHPTPWRFSPMPTAREGKSLQAKGAKNIVSPQGAIYVSPLDRATGYQLLDGQRIFGVNPVRISPQKAKTLYLYPGIPKNDRIT